jgi:hypothetical protein
MWASPGLAVGERAHVCCALVVLQIRVWPGREASMDLQIKLIEREDVPPWVLTAIGAIANGRGAVGKPKLKADASANPEQKRPRCVCAHRACARAHRVCARAHRVCARAHRVCAPAHRVCAPAHRVCARAHRVCVRAHRVRACALCVRVLGCLSRPSSGCGRCW